jgi:hypothetical protein
VNPTQVNSNAAGTTASWFRVEVQFQNTTADYSKIGATAATGAAAGNGAGGGTRRIGANAGTTAFTEMSIAEIVYYAGVPSAGQLTALDAYATARYGAGLV